MLGDHAQAHVLHHRQRVGQRDVVAAGGYSLKRSPPSCARAVQRQAQVVRRRSAQQACSTSLAAIAGRHRFDVAGRQRAADSGWPASGPLPRRGARPAARAARPASCARCAPASASSAGRSTSTCSPAFGRTIMCSCASGDSPIWTLVSTRSPCSARISIASMRCAHLGAEAVARDVDQRRDRSGRSGRGAGTGVLRTRSCRPRMPMLVRNSSSSLDWNSSSRGSVSRMWRSALPLWLFGARPEAGHHVLVALAHQRDVPRAAVVGAGGVQAEEALLARSARPLASNCSTPM